MLREYAITFYALLSEGYKNEAQEYLTQINIQNLDSMSKQERMSFLMTLELQAKGSDILNTDAESSSTEELKRVIG